MSTELPFPLSNLRVSPALRMMKDRHAKHKRFVCLNRDTRREFLIPRDARARTHSFYMCVNALWNRECVNALWNGDDLARSITERALHRT